MSSRSRKTKAEKRDVLAGKRDPESQLYRAVRRYVESKGGSLMVIGGVETQEWPEDGKFKFRVAVRCMGRKPAGKSGVSASSEVPRG